MIFKVPPSATVIFDAVYGASSGKAVLPLFKVTVSPEFTIISCCGVDAIKSIVVSVALAVNAKNVAEDAIKALIHLYSQRLKSSMRHESV